MCLSWVTQNIATSFYTNSIVLVLMGACGWVVLKRVGLNKKYIFFFTCFTICVFTLYYHMQLLLYLFSVLWFENPPLHTILNIWRTGPYPFERKNSWWFQHESIEKYANTKGLSSERFLQKKMILKVWKLGKLTSGDDIAMLIPPLLSFPGLSNISIAGDLPFWIPFIMDTKQARKNISNSYLSKGKSCKTFD